MCLLKGSSKEDPNNCRPISVLPTLSKSFERHLSNRLNSFLKKKKKKKKKECLGNRYCPGSEKTAHAKQRLFE